MKPKKQKKQKVQEKQKKKRFRRFLKTIGKPFKSKKLWVIVNIVLSYVAMYGAPIFILYWYTRDKFFRETIVDSRYSLQFIGFVAITIIFLLALLIKVGIKVIKSKPSIGKYVFTTLLWFAVLVGPLYLVYKLYNFTFVIEENTLSFFNSMREFIIKVKNSIWIFMGCIGASSIFKFIALIIDKEYVRKLDWL